MILLSGKPIRDKLERSLSQETGALFPKPKLAIIQVGDNPESTTYIGQKKKCGEKIGVSVDHIIFPETVSEEELVGEIEILNHDSEITGIIVQLPIPKNLNTRRILDNIAESKDVDGLGIHQIGLLHSGRSNVLLPATARGTISLFDYYKIELSGKHIVVIGRSNLVGKPLATLCLSRNATVTVCHSHTRNLSDITRTADVLIVACGVPKMIGKDYVREDQVVIDVGIHKNDGVLCGDVNFEEVKDIVQAISPVPGGIGLLTVVSLFQNLLDAYNMQKVV